MAAIHIGEIYASRTCITCMCVCDMHAALQIWTITSVQDMRGKKGEEKCCILLRHTCPVRIPNVRLAIRTVHVWRGSLISGSQNMSVPVVGCSSQQPASHTLTGNCTLYRPSKALLQLYASLNYSQRFFRLFFRTFFPFVRSFAQRYPPSTSSIFGHFV